MISTTAVRVIVGLAIVAAVGAGVTAAWRHYESLVADLATARADLEKTDRALEVAIGAAEAERADRARVDGLLADRRRAADRLQRERDEYVQKLNDANRDPAARQWLDADVPRAVWCSLQQRPAAVDCDQGRGADPAGGAAGRHAGTGAARGDGLRIDRVLASARGGAGELQP